MEARYRPSIALPFWAILICIFLSLFDLSAMARGSPRVSFERNAAGSIEDLYCDNPSKSDLARLAREDFALTKLRLINVDLGSSPFLMKLARSPTLRELKLEQSNLTKVSGLVEGASQPSLTWVHLYECRMGD